MAAHFPTVQWDAKISQGKVACQFAEKSQDILLEYATSQLKFGNRKQKVKFRGMTDVDAFEAKSKIFSIQNDYNSAIYYIEKAMGFNDTNRLCGQKKILFDCLLSSLKEEFDEAKISKAKEIIDNMEKMETKLDFDFQLRRFILTHEITNKDEKLTDLKSSILSFEESVKNQEDLCSNANVVWVNSRSVMDYATNILKDDASNSQVKKGNLFSRESDSTFTNVRSFVRQSGSKTPQLA